MKLANFLITLVNMVITIAIDAILFGISFHASIIMASVPDSPPQADEVSAMFTTLFWITLFIFAFAETAFILNFVAIGRAKRAPTKTYTLYYGIICGLSLLCSIGALPCISMVTELLPEASFMYAWPITGGALMLITLILTVINAVTGRKKIQAHVAGA